MTGGYSRHFLSGMTSHDQSCRAMTCPEPITQQSTPHCVLLSSSDVHTLGCLRVTCCVGRFFIRQLSPCRGSARMDIKPSSPSSWPDMPTYTSKDDWNPTALTVSVQVQEERYIWCELLGLTPSVPPVSYLPQRSSRSRPP